MQNWNISKRLMFLCACFMVNILLVQAVGRWNVSQLSKVSKQVMEQDVVPARYAALIDMMHNGIRAAAYRSFLVTEVNDEAGKKEVREELQNFGANIESYFEKLSEITLSPEVTKHLADLKPAMVQYHKDGEKLANVVLAGNRRQGLVDLENFQATFASLEKSLDALGDAIESDADAHSKQDEAVVHWADVLGLCIFLLSMGLGVFNGWFSIRDINKSMRDVVGRLRKQSGSVSETAEHVSQTSADLSSASVRQAEALQETSSAVEEMSAMIKRTAENATQSREVASKSQDSASKGKRTVEEMISAIQEINRSNEAIGRQTDESNRQISEIVKVINEIGAKTKVINDIVFQTKLLSFNASVEAARAGEHGKGFAVVAEEVGNLAQMSGNASKEISDMLGASISRVEQIVNQTKSEIERLMNQNKSKVDAGARVASQCGEVFDEMYRNVSAVNDRINEISTATTEQSHGINEITKAMNSLDQVTHANSASSQQAASASGELKMQAQGLVTAIMKLEHLAGANDETVHTPAVATSTTTAKKSEHSATAVPTLTTFGSSTPPWKTPETVSNVPGKRLAS